MVVSTLAVPLGRRFFVMLLVVGLTALLYSRLAGSVWLNLGSIGVSHATLAANSSQLSFPIERAIAPLQRATEYGGARSRAYEGLVKIHTLAREYGRAGQAFQQYLSLTSDAVVGTLFLSSQALACLQQGDTSDVEQIRSVLWGLGSTSGYQQHRSDYQEEANLLINWAGDQERERRYPQAEAAYKMATAVAPSWVEGYLRLGGFYRGQKRWDDAIAAYNSAIEIDPTGKDGLVGLGRVYMDRGLTQDAGRLFDAGTEALKRGAFEWGQVMIGQAHEWKGDVSGAIEAYKSVVASHQQHASLEADPTWSAYFRLGSIYEDRKEYDLAIEYYQGAASVSHQYGMDARALGYVAGVYRLEGKQKAAIMELEYSLDLLDGVNSQDGLKLSLLRKLGNLCWGTQEEQCAMNSYEQILRLDPSDETARSRLNSMKLRNQ